MSLVTDRIVSLLILLGMFVVMYWRMNAAKTAKELPTIRQIAGLDALKEAVGRATELGRPVHYSTGIGAIADEFGPQTIAGLTMLQYVSKLCA